MIKGLKKNFKFLSEIKSFEEVEGGLKISGYASTSAVDRAGDTIEPEAWLKGGLANYNKNPIILFNHDYDKPIGRCVKLEVDSKGLYIEAIISSSAKQYGLIKDGVLSTFSVGFLINLAEYDEETYGFIVKDAELLEISVVSVPCNQDATFQLKKSFKSQEEYETFRKELLALTNKDHTNDEADVNASQVDTGGEQDLESQERIKKMDEMEKMIAAAADKAAAAATAAIEKAAAEKAAAEKAAAEAAAKTAEQTALIVKTVEEKAVDGFKKALEENNNNWQKTFDELKGDLAEKSAEIQSLRESKAHFADRGARTGNWEKEFEADIDTAYLMARATAAKGKRDIGETAIGKSLMEKVNTFSTVQVSSDKYETIASTNIQRDIQNELVITPLFREIEMNAATMVLPIMPDAGYAEITGAKTASGDAPNGNMAERGDTYGTPYGGLTLQEVNLTTSKIISHAFLANETEEDAIMPILPLIRESMIRSHARSVDNMILAGNDVEGNYTSGAKDGLIKLTRTNNRRIENTAANTPLTAAALLNLRKAMGKYGVRAKDVVYIVSQAGYFELLQDPEFQDIDLVGALATKVSGEIGQVYGSKVIMSDEFVAAAGKTQALAVNTRNFVVPRLRGLTVESDYEVRHQHRVLVTSQRLGFNEIIPNAPSVVSLALKTA